MSYELREYTYSVGESVESIAGSVKKNGLAIIEDYFGIYDLNSLDKEVSKYFDQMNPKDQWIIESSGIGKTKDSYMAGKVIRITPSSYSMFPTLSTMFIRDIWMHKVIDNFYGTSNNKYMQIFATHETIRRNSEWEDGMNHNAGLHFDPYQSFKIATYLQDTTRENGAFKIIPGSSFEGKKNRENLKPTMWKGQSILDCSSPFKGSSYSLDDVVYVEAKAGSLILFDTDAWHGGGEIHSDDLERKFVVCHNRQR